MVGITEAWRTGEGGPGGLKPFQLNVSVMQEVKLKWQD